MSSLAAVGLLAAGIVLVVGGAEAFFDGVVAVAARLRISAFVVTALVSGFEVENLAAGIAANAKGLPDAAAGTFLGGATFLALAVTGLAAATRPIVASLPRPVFLWAGASPLPLLALALDGRLTRLDGALLVAWFALAMTGLAHAGRNLLAHEGAHRKRLPLVRLLAGLGLLFAGGELLGDGIRRAVTRLGASEALLGNTVVAASVEAEEVGRVAVPARRGRGDVALGNILGTLVHFLALNAGVIALVRPLELDGVTRALHLPVAAAATALVAALTARRSGLGRLQASLLLTLYAAYVGAAVAVSL